MPKKKGETLDQQIARVEAYVLGDLYPRYKAYPYRLDIRQELSQYLGVWTGMVRLYAGQLYQRRDYQNLDLATQIDLVECQALRLHTWLAQVRRDRQDSTVTVLDAELDTVMVGLKRLYVERSAERRTIDTATVGTTDIKFIGPEKTGRTKHRRTSRQNRSTEEQSKKSAA